jgi:exonuclease III
MRDNLLFHNLPEEKDENCEQKVLTFIKEKLNIEGQEVRLQRAHRIGPFNPSKTRPIVAKFSDYPVREDVRRAAKNLKGTNFGISEQYPKEVVEKRRQLVPIMVQARKDGKEAYLRVDKLYINKQLYRGSCKDKSESVIKCLSWNVEGLTSDKKQTIDFVDFLCEYDIICLSESWTNSNSKIDIAGYSNPIHSFRKYQNRRAKRSSGGLIVYIKNSIRKGVTLERNTIDCIIWIKLDKVFFNMDDNVFICFTYIAPESSPVHNIYNVDIFIQLEQDILLFNDRGKIFLAGDLNCRTGSKPDYIQFDRNIGDDEVITVDTPTPRISRDSTSNRFGDCLLDMCKATNQLIVNGRWSGDGGHFTCMTHNGTSVVDYLLTHRNNFDLLAHFAVGEFLPFSNHAPLSFSLKVSTVCRNVNGNVESKFYKFDNKYKEVFTSDIANNLDCLIQI